MAVKTARTHSRDAYFELVQAFPLTLIKSEHQLKGAERVVDGLLTKGELDQGETEYLEVLSKLMADFEAVQYRFEPVSDADMLRHLMEAKGVTQADLHRATGIAKSTLSQILRGERAFSKHVMATLAEYFHVSIGVLARNV